MPSLTAAGAPAWMLPNFLIIGAPRSATTTLYDALAQHPSTYMSPDKEPWYFAVRDLPLFAGPGDAQGVRDPAAYAALFAAANGAAAVGEGSTLYLWSEHAAARLARELPAVRLIAMLRNPVDRAYSQYQQHVWLGRETLDFGAALAAEEARATAGWAPFWRYRELGRYDEQLERYFSLFDRRQILVLLHDDFCRDPLAEYRRVCAFLEIDDSFTPDLSLSFNLSGVPKSRVVHWAVLNARVPKALLRPFVPTTTRRRALLALNARNVRRVPLEAGLRAQLQNEFAPSISRLEALIQRDLADWTSGSAAPAVV